MLLLMSDTCGALLAAFAENPPKLIIAPEHVCSRGHPVLFASPLFEALQRLDRDTGAKDMIEQNGDSLLMVPVEDSGVFQDLMHVRTLSGIRAH